MFQPQYAIGIGERSHYYTLRVSHPVYVPGDGPNGNAVVNGVYQGKVAVGWHHVQNLSQNAQEAIAKAKDIALATGIPLVSVSAAELGEQLNEIKRATDAELQERERVAKANAEAFAARLEAEEKLRMLDAVNGYIPAGMGNAGKRIAEVSFAYACWLRDKRDELTGAPRAVADYLIENFPGMAPWPVEDVISFGNPGQRLKGLKVQVQRTIPVETMYGRSWLIIAVDKDGCRIKHFCSGAKWAEPGDVCYIDATVKGPNEYNGECSTQVQRVKVTERIPYAAPWDELNLLDQAGIAQVAENTAAAWFGPKGNAAAAAKALTANVGLPEARDRIARIDLLEELLADVPACQLLRDSITEALRPLYRAHRKYLAEKLAEECPDEDEPAPVTLGERLMPGCTCGAAARGDFERCSCGD